ncbi:hypothetical protein DFH06DRAFT_1463748 [Mycena polygramma]|nr:hypothetical protein DFH06DRAFT_1488916 [Mycena polygramma]KAJ7604162.1 hypothetical protein DFH06DRAFT_1487761 [Mycena polygramma]KAJ7685809.1 hypothetical protein DFH06DRAFT_1463748 [Mycena polygramma]
MADELKPPTNATTSLSTTAAPQGVDPIQQTATTRETVLTTEPLPEHSKQGLGALVEKIVHPTHGGSHTHSHTETVAVPITTGDGSTDLAPGSE